MESGQTGYWGEPFPLAPEIASHYSCVTPHFGRLQGWQVSCLSNDNVWLVNFFSFRVAPDVDDFVTVLRHLASAQKTSLSPP
jgi:hypothetical protein